VLVIPSSNNQNDVPHVYERKEEQKLENNTIHFREREREKKKKKKKKKLRTPSGKEEHIS